MAHLAQRQFVSLVSEKLGRFFDGCSVLEIGSLDISGSVRDFFRNCKYVGVDVAEGRGVDVVCQGQDYDGPDNSFDQVISCEVMEHNPHWAATFENMIRLCRPGGLIVMTCATTGRGEHGTTRTAPDYSPLTVKLGWDYYRNLSVEDFRQSTDIESKFSHYAFWVNWSSYDLYFCGLKAGSLDVRAEEWSSLVSAITDQVSRDNRRRICAHRAFVARYFGERWFIAMRWLASRFGIGLLRYVYA